MAQTGNSNAGKHVHTGILFYYNILIIIESIICSMVDGAVMMLNLNNIFTSLLLFSRSNTIYVCDMYVYVYEFHSFVMLNRCVQCLYFPVGM